jgi:hypothetical protein
MADRDNAARDVAVQLGISLSTLYAYVDAQGKPRPRSAELLVECPAFSEPVSMRETLSQGAGYGTKEEVHP